jgi:hypothetical protein
MKDAHTPRDNRKTALLLLTVAAAFFVAVVAKVWLAAH